MVDPAWRKVGWKAEDRRGRRTGSGRLRVQAGAWDAWRRAPFHFCHDGIR